MRTRAAAARIAASILTETDAIEQSPNPGLLPRISQRQGKAPTNEANLRKKISMPKFPKELLGDPHFRDDIVEGAVVGNFGVKVEEANQNKLLETGRKSSDTGSGENPSEISLTIPLAVPGKRKRAASKFKNADFVNGEAINGGWDKLPHNLGSVGKSNITVKSVAIEDRAFFNDTTVSKIVVDVKSGASVKDGNSAVGFSQHMRESVDKLGDIVDLPLKKIKKGKANPYRLTPGESPFPDFIMPTTEACKEVQDLLTEAHGSVEPPKEIPPPSLDVTGCGEVPSILDAMIRTRLSAATTTTNAKYAFQGLVQRYGILEEGIGMGSVDWNKVRESDVREIENAIKRGGLAKTKSISIKSILEIVYQTNIARRDAFLKEKATGESANMAGAESMTQAQKDMEIEMAEKRILSLQFIHHLDSDKAMIEFIKFPGIGVKTASCIILFCLQRPSFAVDTHVHRLCRWLKWIPENSTRDQAFSHCEVKIPNAMKYSLHQLFIRHGKTCRRCRAATGEGSEDWVATVCPIEHLVVRTGKRKAAGPSRSVAVGKIQKRSKKKANIVDTHSGSDSETETTRSSE